MSATSIRSQANSRMRFGLGKVASYTVLFLFAAVYQGRLLMLVNTALKTIQHSRWAYHTASG